MVAFLLSLPSRESSARTGTATAMTVNITAIATKYVGRAHNKEFILIALLSPQFLAVGHGPEEKKSPMPHPPSVLTSFLRRVVHPLLYRG
jgi:hypothetical protein